MISKNQTCFASDIIYIGKTSLLNEKCKDINDANLILINDNGICIKEFFKKDLNIIEFNELEDVFELYNQTRDLFIKDTEIEHYTATLFKAYMTGKGLDYIVKTASKMFGNPVVVIDLSYKVLAYSNIEDIDDPIWIDNIKKGYCSYDFIATVRKMKSVQAGIKSEQPYEVRCKGSSNVKLVSKVKINNKHVGNVILFLECKKDIQPKDIELLTLTSGIVAEEMKKNILYRNSNNIVYEDLIYDLLENRLSDRKLFQERMRSANLKFGEKLSILALDISKYNYSGKYLGYLRDNLDMFFPSKKSVYYNDNIVVIYDEEISNISPEKMKSIKEFLTSNNLYLGISNEFSDIMECRSHYLQAVKALEIGKIVRPGDPLIFYFNIKLYDLLFLAYNRLEHKDFSNPVLIKLKEYDRLNNTDLYNTLFVYLKNNRNIKKTSQELFVHRNTIRFRIQKIIELTHIDFTDADNILNIYLSFKIMDYLEKVNLQE